MASEQALWKARGEELEAMRARTEEEAARRERDYRERMAEAEARCRGVQERADGLNRENRALAADLQAARKELELMRGQASREAAERDRRFQEQLRLVQEQLQNATREMLGRRSQELSQKNNEQMAAIIAPLKDNIREMRVAMDQSRDAHAKNTASLERAIEEVMKRAGEIGTEADKLASALRGENKVQGNWGELILDELLESQGLTEGIHYEKQATLRDSRGNALLNEETGRRMIPDTILHYPDGKDAIIDSKVSLTAFVDYQNAETDEARAEALQRHLRSVRQHVAELARKDYSAYIKPPAAGLELRHHVRAQRGRAPVGFGRCAGTVARSLLERRVHHRRAEPDSGPAHYSDCLDAGAGAEPGGHLRHGTHAARPRGRLHRPFRERGTEVAGRFGGVSESGRQTEGRPAERGGRGQQAHQAGSEGEPEEDDSGRERAATWRGVTPGSPYGYIIREQAGESVVRNAARKVAIPCFRLPRDEYKHPLFAGGFLRAANNGCFVLWLLWRSSPGFPARPAYGCVRYWMDCPSSVMPTASMLRAVRWLLL